MCHHKTILERERERERVILERERESEREREREREGESVRFMRGNTRSRAIPCGSRGADRRSRAIPCGADPRSRAIPCGPSAAAPRSRNPRVIPCKAGHRSRAIPCGSCGADPRSRAIPCNPVRSRAGQTPDPVPSRPVPEPGRCEMRITTHPHRGPWQPTRHRSAWRPGKKKKRTPAFHSARSNLKKWRTASTNRAPDTPGKVNTRQGGRRPARRRSSRAPR